MKLASMFVLCLAACGGEAFTSQAVTAASDAGNVTSEVGPVGSGGAVASEAAASRDVLADPWPDDVIVEPMPDGPPVCEWGGTPATGCPCVNCFLFDRPDGTTDHYTCCDGSGYPPDSATDHLCTQGDYPTPHKAYCPLCGCR